MYDSMEQNECGGSGTEEENQRLRQEVEELKQEVQRYKLLAETFEKKYVDSVVQLNKKGEELSRMKPASTGSSIAAVSPVDNTEHSDEVVRRIFVGGLSHTTTSESLKEYFSQFGEIEDCIVMFDPVSHKSRCFGFVKYTEASMVDAAQAARPHKVDNKVVDTKRAVTKQETSDVQTSMIGKVKRIFIGGLRMNTTDSVIREYFSKFGSITQVNTFEDKNTKQKKGFAYVTFDDSDAVDKVCQQRYHTIDDRRVEVKRAQSKSETMQHKGQAAQGGTVPQGPMPPDMIAGAFNPYAMMSSFMPGMNPQMWMSAMQGAGSPAAGAWGWGAQSGAAQAGSKVQGDFTGWNSGSGAGTWNATGVQNAVTGDVKSANNIGPMRGGRFSERSSGPYGSNFGPYGSVQQSN